MLRVLKLCVLVAAVAVLPGKVDGRFGHPDFWQQFPDMWRGTSSASGFPSDVATRRRFEDWRTAQRSMDLIPLGNRRNIHDVVRQFFSPDESGGIQAAMLSLGMLGDSRPLSGHGQFSFSSLFPELQKSLAPKEWWKGPNVCVERREEDLLANQSTAAQPSARNDSTEGDGSTSTLHINSCAVSPDDNAYSCVTQIQKSNFHRKYSVKYQCCYGFSRENDDMGCPKEIPMTDLPETLRNLKLTSLIQALSDSGIQSLLANGNYTIFAPSNDAFEEFQRPNNDVMSSGPAPNLRSTLESHIVPGLVRSADFTDEQILQSLHNSSIRMNLFTSPSQLVTADCSRIVSLNNLAKNGVVYIVDRIIRPATKNLEMTLRDDGRFGTLLQLLDDANLLDLLRDPSAHITVLAPTDESFRLMDRSVRNRLTDDKRCLKRVLQTHVLPSVICSAVIQRNAVTRNALNKAVTFDRDANRLTVQNITIESVDHMATNGMFHVLDGVIIPEEAKALLQIAADAGLDSYLALVRKADLTSTIDASHNLTIFAPSNRAFDRLSEEIRAKLSGSKQDLTDILNYHIVQPAVLLTDFKDNLKLDTALAGQSLRMNIFQQAFPFSKNIITLNCARISIANYRGCDGTIHVLEKVLIPPTGDVLQFLENNGNYTRLLEEFRKAGLDQALRGSGPFTIFAPDDAAFARLTADERQLISSNATLAKSIMQLHVFPRQICCSSVMEDSLFFSQYSRSINPIYSLPLHRNRAGEIHIAGATVQRCDNIAQNGVVHLVDEVIFPKNFL